MYDFKIFSEQQLVESIEIKTATCAENQAGFK